MSQEHLVDFDKYLDIAKSFKKLETIKEDCSVSEKLLPNTSVQYEKIRKDKFDPYPWINTTSLIRPHKLDSNYVNIQTNLEKNRSTEVCCIETVEHTRRCCGGEPECKQSFTCFACTIIFLFLLFITSSSGRIYYAI
jgi:hypothetical protein